MKTAWWKNLTKGFRKKQFEPHSVIRDIESEIRFEGTPDEASAWMQKHLKPGTFFTNTTTFQETMKGGDKTWQDPKVSIR